MFEKELQAMIFASKEASKKILFSDKKDYVLSVGENKTLNAAFESVHLKDKYLSNYSKIKYQKHKNFFACRRI